MSIEEPGWMDIGLMVCIQNGAKVNIVREIGL